MSTLHQKSVNKLIYALIPDRLLGQLSDKQKAIEVTLFLRPFVVFLLFGMLEEEMLKIMNGQRQYYDYDKWHVFVACLLVLQDILESAAGSYFPIDQSIRNEYSLLCKLTQASKKLPLDEFQKSLSRRDEEKAVPFFTPRAKVEEGEGYADFVERFKGMFGPYGNVDVLTKVSLDQLDLISHVLMRRFIESLDKSSDSQLAASDFLWSPLVLRSIVGNIAKSDYAVPLREEAVIVLQLATHFGMTSDVYLANMPYVVAYPTN